MWSTNDAKCAKKCQTRRQFTFRNGTARVLIRVSFVCGTTRSILHPDEGHTYVHMYPSFREMSPSNIDKVALQIPRPRKSHSCIASRARITTDHIFSESTSSSRTKLDGTPFSEFTSSKWVAPRHARKALTRMVPQSKGIRRHHFLVRS